MALSRIGPKKEAGAQVLVFFFLRFLSLSYARVDLLGGEKRYGSVLVFSKSKPKVSLQLQYLIQHEKKGAPSCVVTRNSAEKRQFNHFSLFCRQRKEEINHSLVYTKHPPSSFEFI